MKSDRKYIPLVVGALLAASPVEAQRQDTIFVEVGSPALDARYFQPHAARVRVYRGDSLVADWINELTVGDSAGRRVHRWVTTGQPVPLIPNRPISVLRQTYDAQSLAPLGYHSKVSNGAEVRLAIDGVNVRGTRRTANDTTPVVVNQTVSRIGFIAGASDLVPLAAGLKPGSVIVAPVWGPNMQNAIDRIFTVFSDTTVMVEGMPVRSIKVEERTRSDRSLYATWYLLRESPYMVYGEIPLPDGRVQRMTEVAVPMSRPPR